MVKGVQVVLLGASSYHLYANAFNPGNPSVPATVKLTLVHEGTKTGCVVITGGFPDPGATTGGVPKVAIHCPATSGISVHSVGT